MDRVKEKGAPIDWIALGEAPAIMVGIGLASQAAHVNAAKLFIDFALSREGRNSSKDLGDSSPNRPCIRAASGDKTDQDGAGESGTGGKAERLL